MSLKERIEKHETYIKSDFFNKHIYGNELLEYMGTDLKKLIINDKHEFYLKGIELNDRVISFYVDFYFEGRHERIVNQQFLSCIERTLFINGNIHLYIS